MQPELLNLSYSPWSEKARWALDARGILYRSTQYQPLIGEPALRLKLRRPFGVVSVPVLITDEEAIGDSWDIARWADERGHGATLFPSDHTADITRWNTLSQRALDAGRTLAMGRVLQRNDALVELIPKPLRGVLGPLAPKVAALGIQRTLRKYRASRGDAEATLSEVLDTLRAALDAHPPLFDGAARTLLGPGPGFTYADIAMAQALAFVKPPEGLKVKPANREAFTHPRLSERYADLIEWRDALYAQHRHAPASPA